MLATPTLTYRTIDPDADARVCISAYLDACRASYDGDDSGFPGRKKHLRWLAARVEEFPEGHVIAELGGRYVGQMELQVPYGLTTGYVNLYYVARDFRGRGYGRQMHAYAERYFRSWEAGRVELHVSKTNDDALAFYERLGYRRVREEGRLLRMALELT